MGLSCTIALGNDEPGKVNPAHERHPSGKRYPRIAESLRGKVPMKGLTYRVWSLRCATHVVAQQNRIVVVKNMDDLNDILFSIALVIG
jgi:hypothetical protein